MIWESQRTEIMENASEAELQANSLGLVELRLYGRDDNGFIGCMVTVGDDFVEALKEIINDWEWHSDEKAWLKPGCDWVDRLDGAVL